MIDAHMKLFYIFMVIVEMALIGKTFSACPYFFVCTELRVLTLNIMWNFITANFTVLKCCAPSVAELFNRRNSIKIERRQTSELSGRIEH